MSEEKIIEHIRKRKDIEPEFWSVRKILEQRSMGMYGKLCCDRIVEAGKTDGENVKIYFSESEKDIAVNYDGFFECREIIEGYIGENEWKKLFDIFFDRKKLINDENCLLRVLRISSKKELKNVIEQIKKIDNKNGKTEILWIEEEIKARKLKNGAIQKMKKLVNRLYIKIKYYRLFVWTKDT